MPVKQASKQAIKQSSIQSASHQLTHSRSFINTLSPFFSCTRKHAFQDSELVRPSHGSSAALEQ
jgi:hypothetical protein